MKRPPTREDLKQVSKAADERADEKEEIKSKLLEEWEWKKKKRLLEELDQSYKAELREAIEEAFAEGWNSAERPMWKYDSAEDSPKKLKDELFKKFNCEKPDK